MSYKAVCMFYMWSCSLSTLCQVINKINVQRPDHYPAQFTSKKERSVFLLIVPVSSSNGDFTSRLKVPPENQFNPLQQVTRNLDMTHIRKMVLGVNIVVLQQTLGREIVDKTTVLEVLIDLPGLFLVVSAADVLLSLLGETSPLRLLNIS